MLTIRNRTETGVRNGRRTVEGEERGEEQKVLKSLTLFHPSTVRSKIITNHRLCVLRIKTCYFHGQWYNFVLKRIKVGKEAEKCHTYPHPSVQHDSARLIFHPSGACLSNQRYIVIIQRGLFSANSMLIFYHYFHMQFIDFVCLPQNCTLKYESSQLQEKQMQEKNEIK